MNSSARLAGFALILSCSAAACISWESGWTVRPDTPGRGDAAALMAKAEATIDRADSREGLAALISAHEAVLKADPEHRGALAALAQYHTLTGAGYRDAAGDKEYHYRQAIRYSERLMVLNPRFRARIDRGQAVWEAVDELGKDEAEAMGWWTTAMFYYFKECVPGIFKPFHNTWLDRNKLIMTRLETVAPEWNGGGNLFNWGIYYLALPEAVGGDMKKSAEYLKRAGAAGPGRLLVPWGRAKYFHVKRDDRAAFERDLRWVLAQDPHKPTGDPYPWNVYFQRDARQLLAAVDSIF